MPRYFFDSSAIVKRYMREQGSSWVQTVCSRRARSSLYLSELAQAEVVAAIRRAGRELVVTYGFHPSSVDAAVNSYERDVQHSIAATANPSYHFVQLTSQVVAIAQRLCNQFWLPPTPPLRSLDAIQLASAIIARAASSDPVTFVTADARLEIIAQAVGFATDNPLRH